MTKKNTLDEILEELVHESSGYDWQNIDYEQLQTEAKQQIAQAIEDAKPNRKGGKINGYGYNKAIEEYYQNLRRSLGL